MQIRRLSILQLILLSTLIFINGCTYSSHCPVQQQLIGREVITYKYDGQNNISMITVTDTVNHINEAYKYRWDREKITVTDDENKSQIYHLDDDQRISSYSIGNMYEYNFVYDYSGRLKSVKKERFEGANLFTTNYIKVDYQQGNPVQIIDSCIVEKGSNGYGSNYITRYTMSYYEPNEVTYTNTSIFPILINRLPAFNYIAYKESTGALPNKLIKSMIRKTDGEQSFRQDFSYKVDNNGNVTDIKVTSSDAHNKNNTEIIRLIYQCDN